MVKNRQSNDEFYLTTILPDFDLLNAKKSQIRWKCCVNE